MKELLCKELKLTAAPITYFFLAFSVMTMLPGYPILVGGFFICMGIFYTFQFAREYNDVIYTALLPVKKEDVVKAKFSFVILIELVGFLLCTLFTGIRMTALRDSAVYKANVMMNANLAYLGYLLIIFMLFNVIFMGQYFKSAYYIGKPYILFCAAAFIMVVAGETLHHLPGLGLLNSQTEGLGLQMFVLTAGIVLYVAGTALAYRKSVVSFEKLDLA